MKKRRVYIFFEIIIAIFFASCTGFFDLGEEKIINLTPANQQPKTIIYFNNTNNYAVDVFDYGREKKLASVDVHQRSNDIPWIPTNDGYDFYFTYLLPVSGEKLPYIPKKGLDYITIIIPRDQTTQIPIPKLTDIITANEKIFDEAYIAIKNNNSYTIQLLSMSSPENPITGSNQVISGRTALYKLSPTKNVTNYSIKIQGSDNMELYKNGLMELESGYLYVIEVKAGVGAGISLTGSKLITLNNL
jgi:hypothetical protein